jgi:hypothetical protein
VLDEAGEVNNCLRFMRCQFTRLRGFVRRTGLWRS